MCSTRRSCFDPDLDPDGRLAADLTDTVVAGLRPRAA